MNKTANYNLNQWEPSDKVQHGDFNADNAKIDAALKALDEKVSGHTASLSKKGDCFIQCFTYTGTGKHGVDNPNYFAFGQKPLLIFIASESYQLVLMQGVTGTWADSNGGSGGSVSVTWKDNTVSWYGSYLAGQMNDSGRTYHVVAFLSSNY